MACTCAVRSYSYIIPADPSFSVVDYYLMLILFECWNIIWIQALELQLQSTVVNKRKNHILTGAVIIITYVPLEYFHLACKTGSIFLRFSGERRQVSASDTREAGKAPCLALHALFVLRSPKKLQKPWKADVTRMWFPLTEEPRRKELPQTHFDPAKLWTRINFFSCAKLSLSRNGHVHWRSYSLHTGLYVHAYSFAVRGSNFFRCVEFWLWRSGKNHSVAYIAYHYQDTEMITIIIIKNHGFYNDFIIWKIICASLRTKKIPYN